MDLNQEQTSGPNEDAQSKVAVSGANNRLLGAALGGAVGILASRLLGVPPKVGATIGSLVGANAEKIGPHLFPGRDSGRIEGESAPRDGDAEPGVSAAPSARALLRELAAERGADALPKSLQDVLDEYLTLGDEDETFAPAEKESQSGVKEVDATSTSPLDSEVEDSAPLQLHKEAKAKPQPPVTEIEDLPIAPPLEAPKAESSFTEVATDELSSSEQEKEAPIKPKKISVGQSPPTFPSTPKVEAPKVEAPKVEAPKVEAPKVETPKVEAPKVEAPKVEAPKVEAPKVETPKVEAPKVETPKVETPKVETPKVETPKVETPKVETPKVETPKVETPKVETPKVETPKVETPVEDPRTDKSESPSLAPFRSSAPRSMPAKEDSNLSLAGKSQSVSTSAAGEASETVKAEAPDRSDVPDVSEKEGISNLFTDTSSTAAPAIAESGQAKLNPEAESSKATVVESLWSRPPSTLEGAGDDDDSVLSAPGVPEQDSSAKNPDLLSDRGKSSIPQKDQGSDLDVAGKQESISEKPDQTDTAAPPPAGAGVSTFKGTSPIFGAKESSPAPIAEKSEQPKVGTPQSLDAPLSGSPASAQTSPPVQEEKSVPPTEKASPGGVQAGGLETPEIAPSPQSRLAPAPPLVSPKTEKEQAPPASKAGITSPKAPLFRPAPKPLASPPAAADPPAKAPRVAPAKQAPPLVSPPPRQSTPAFAPAPAAPGTASPIGKSAAPPSAENAKKDAPVFPAVKQPGAATNTPASAAPGAGAPGVAKPALFTTIPAVAPEIVSGAKTILPTAKTGAPPATPAAETMPAKPAVSLSATQTVEPTGEAAMSRLFKTADPQPGTPTPEAKEPAPSNAPFAEAKKTNNPFKSAPPAESQQATQAEPPTARKPSTTQGPNPFMSSSTPSKSGEATSAAAPPPLPGGVPANDLGATTAPFKSVGKGAVTPFLTPKKESEDTAPPSAETPSPEAPPKDTDTDIDIKPAPTAPVAEVTPPNPAGEAAPINPSSETSKPKWRKASTGADEKDGKTSLVAASQKLETKEAKGAVVEGAPSASSTAETTVAKKPEKASKDKPKVKSSAPPSKGGLGRKLLILSFPVVAIALGAAAIALKPVITNLVSQASSGMFTPDMVPANDPLAPDPGEALPTETPAMGVPDNAVTPGGANSILETGDGGVLPPTDEEPVGDATESVSIPEGAVVQILPAGDVPGQPDSSVTPPVDPEENLMVDGIVDPIVKEFETAKNVVRSLLLSSSTQEASQWVHDSEATEQMMKLYYGSTGLTPTESLAIDLVNAGTVPGSERNAYLMKVTSPDHPEGFPVSIEQTPEGYKVDWDAYIQCKDRLLEKFYTSKPSIPESFYVTLKRSHHFAPEGATAEAKVLSNKLCFKVSSPLPTDPSQYVYADLNSVVGKELEARIKWNKVYFPVVELEWVPADGQHNGYMRISKFVRDTWRKAR